MPTVRRASRIAGLRPNPFADMDATIASLRAAGADVIDLSKGNPDGRAPDDVAREGAAAALRSDNFAYSDFDGKPEFLRAAADWYRRMHGVELDPGSQLLATLGASDALTSLAMALLDPGDVIVTAEPYYPPYEAMAAVTQARLVTLPASADHGFLPDLDAVDDDLWRRTKLLLLNYPNNPTGAVTTPEFFRTATSLARRFGFVIANDFAYAGLGYGDGGRTASLLASAGDAGDDNGGDTTSINAGIAAVEICSLSKMYTLAGWRAGFIAGDTQVIAAVKAYHHQMGSEVATLVQDAGAAALNGDQSSVRALARRYGRRHALVARGLRDIGLETFASCGGMFAWVRAPKGWRSANFARMLLDEAAVATLPGTAFGEAGEGYVRLSLMKDDEVLDAAIGRIARTTARW